ncbi:hypothetical protein PHYSODRAFT_251535 [Phytophthora sojae]|uniref:Uncharacterized protein n=1 Tax=Phytophthora sojae (strain P6497) TaxID=1094619 RepID=G5AEP4_PHYSP|nr:hypothetical protein PHYSODRAFT_251535 [Phytophthora sojae]EGZ05684.1 hypothetical protein PHYSODRAFT_251535 [Phytophthora sojae]|eukprot:XP_009538545.1 hypothetical protein PHYSODRAFT_251535 [Phytophthora sojae]
MPSTEESESGSDKTSSTEVTLEIPETVKTTETYALSVGVYRFRAVWGSVGLAAALLGVMQIFANNGVQVGSFRSVDLDPDGQKELLDTYNGRLASLTSTVMKPLDIFLSMLVAVVFLCLKTKWSVHFESRRQFVVVAIIGLVGYLLDYGFNSLNLQVVPGDIQPRIMPDDLALQTIVDVAQELSVDGFLVTTKDAKFREDSPDNSLLNTIMRNLIIAPEEVPTWCNDFDAYSSPHKNVMASYGFPARPWQQYALSKALEPTGSGSFPMTTAAVDLPPDRNLPMDESVATNLAVYALLVSNSFLGWWRGDNQAWTFSTAVHSTGTLSLAEHFNLTTRSSSDATFLSNAHKVIVDYFSRAENANTTDELARIEFSRVNLSEMIVFDALTIDIPTRKFGKQEDNSSASNPFYEPVSDYRCNTQACVLEKHWASV